MFFKKQKIVYSTFKLCYQKMEKKKRRKKQFIAQSARAESVDIINFFLLAIKRQIWTRLRFEEP